MTVAVFYGTAAESIPPLAALLTIAEVPLVVTQPDRPRGRSGRPQPPPLKVAAEAWGLRVLQPERAAETIDAVGGVAPDVAVVTAFGQLLPPELLEVPRMGFVNVHFSLLPRWRGASPVVRSILAGDASTGVTIIQVDEGLDTGPVVVGRTTPIGDTETAGELTARLAGLGSLLLVEELPRYLTGEGTPVAQDESAATAAAKIRGEEAFLDPEHHTTEAVLRAVRAFNPRPGAWSMVDGARLKLWRAAPGGHAGGTPGTAEVVDDRVVLGARDGVVELLDVQPEGRGRMPARDWMLGRRDEPARWTTR
jgi:methionyl-tRNA formyltransferase